MKTFIASLLVTFSLAAQQEAHPQGVTTYVDCSGENQLEVGNGSVITMMDAPTVGSLAVVRFLSMPCFIERSMTPYEAQVWVTFDNVPTTAWIYLEGSGVYVQPDIIVPAWMPMGGFCNQAHPSDPTPPLDVILGPITTDLLGQVLYVQAIHACPISFQGIDYGFEYATSSVLRVEIQP